MAQATAPTAPHHVTTVELGERGNADVWIREAGMIDVDMPTRTGGTYTLGSDPLSAGNSADALEAGDNYGYSELSPEAMTALAAALRAGIRAETQHRPDSTEDTQASTSPCPPWCADGDRADHWNNPGKVWQALHPRRFGPVVVYFPEELPDDGMRWGGACEVVIQHPEHTQQQRGESALTVQEAAELGGQLRRAAAFATWLDERVADLFRQGVYSDTEQVA